MLESPSNLRCFDRHQNPPRRSARASVSRTNRCVVGSSGLNTFTTIGVTGLTLAVLLDSGTRPSAITDDGTPIVPDDVMLDAGRLNPPPLKPSLRPAPPNDERAARWPRPDVTPTTDPVILSVGYCGEM
jgi:hypothetical protein